MYEFSNVKIRETGAIRFERDHDEDCEIVEYFARNTDIIYDTYSIRYPVESGRRLTASNIELDAVSFRQSFVKLDIHPVTKEVLLRDIVATIGDPIRASYVAKAINEDFKRFLFPTIGHKLTQGATLAQVKLTEIVSTNLSLIRWQIMKFLEWRNTRQLIPYATLPKIMMHPMVFEMFLKEHQDILAPTNTPGELTLFGCSIVREAQLPKNMALVGILPTDLPQHDLDRLPEAFIRMGIEPTVGKLDTGEQHDQTYMDTK